MSSPNALLKYIPVSLRALAAAALIAGVVLGARSWLVSHDAAVQLKATLAVQAKTVQDAALSQQQRDASLANALAAITAAKNAVRTPAQAAAEIPHLLPPLPDPEPVRVELPATPPDPSPAEPSDSVPTGSPPAAIDVPQADLKPLYDYLQDCRACQAQLAATKADLADERRKTAALTQERDAAIRATHGTFWSRVGHSAKWALIGGAVAAIALTIAPQKSP